LFETERSVGKEREESGERQRREREREGGGLKSMK
jgi:hypothetical protein